MTPQCPQLGVSRQSALMPIFSVVSKKQGSSPVDPMGNSTTKMGVAQSLEWGGLLPNLLRSVEVKSCRSLLSNGSFRTESPAMADKSARTFDPLK